MRSIVLASCVATLWLAGCGNSTTAPICVPGRVESCPCPTGGAGAQECLANGTFGACVCLAIDAGAVADVGLDASTQVDGGVLEDAAPLDAAIEDGSANDDAAPVDAATDAAVPIHGHAVLFGWSGLAADDALDREILNAVFLTERGGPIEVLDYIEHSDFGGGWDTQGRVHALVDAEAHGRGRTVSYRDLTRSTSLEAMLPTASVLFIYPQPHTNWVELGNVGAAWHDAIDAYLDAGGVVIVLTSRDVHEEWRLVSGAGLFNSLGDATGSGSANTEIVMPLDPVAAGVISPYPAPVGDGIHCFPGLSGGVLVARTTNDGPSPQPLPTLCPTLRHLAR